MSATLRDGREPTEPDIRPRVATRQNRVPVYLFIAGMTLLAVLLFSVLDARRQALLTPQTPVVADLVHDSGNPPLLFVPPSLESPEAQPRYAIQAPPAPFPLRPTPSLAWDREPGNSRGGLQISQPPLQIYQPTARPVNLGQANPGGEAPRASSSPALVIDVSVSDAGAAPQAGAAAAAGSAPLGIQGASRVRSGRLANPSTTVPQGTSIPAVLETALDSTRPGQSRALVTLDVRGFDGTKVLIPRGSRLYGEYDADLQTGQNRALIQWTRLLRPDGVTIAIGSPAGDRLGRAGVRGKVNSHFFERFFSAILQSSLDVGVALASRSAGSGGILLIPGTLGQALPKQTEVKPTLTVKQGRSISVLVARDLDFAAVAGR